MIRILIVEDDRDLNLAMGTFLRRRGYEVSAAHCVPEAWDELAEHRHDLIISDIMMDKVDGFEFARMIRQEDRDIPIIFISARRMTFRPRYAASQKVWTIIWSSLSTSRNLT